MQVVPDTHIEKKNILFINKTGKSPALSLFLKMGWPMIM
jgi:hypothetical protein